MKPLTRLSLSASIAGFTLSAVGLAYAVFGGELFSPGPLNASERSETPRQGVHSHAELAGNCGACHATPLSGQTMAGLCKGCHGEIQEQITRSEPLHGKLSGADNCGACHSEHRGAEAALTSFTKFDHGATRFPLTGAHRQLDCNACHNGHEYRGTPTSCVDCHAEPKVHLGKFGLACAECHSTETWKGAKFEHRFPLNHGVGKRRTLECTKCHTTPGDYQAYTCYECHEHERSKMQRKHKRVDPLKLDTCAECHPDGREKPSRNWRERGGRREDD